MGNGAAAKVPFSSFYERAVAKTASSLERESKTGSSICALGSFLPQISGEVDEARQLRHRIAQLANAQPRSGSF